MATRVEKEALGLLGFGKFLEGFQRGRRRKKEDKTEFEKQVAKQELAKRRLASKFVTQKVK